MEDCMITPCCMDNNKLRCRRGQTPFAVRAETGRNNSTVALYKNRMGKFGWSENGRNLERGKDERCFFDGAMTLNICMILQRRPLISC
jgi:hypothetical protein